MCLQFVLLPFLGFLALTFFPNLPEPSAIALLVVTTSPGGGFSGLWCYLSNADLALSVAMTTASTLVSVVALPLNLALYITFIYGRTAAVDFGKLLASCALVVAAVACGYAVSRRWPIPNVRQLVSAIGSTAGVCHMAFGGAANGTSGSPWWEHDWDWFAAVCLPVLGGLTIAMTIAKFVELPNPQAVAVAIECWCASRVWPHPILPPAHRSRRVLVSGAIELCVPRASARAATKTSAWRPRSR